MIRQPSVAATFAVGFLIFVLIFGLFLTVLPLHLADMFGLDAGARGVMISLPAVTSTLAAFNLGRIRAVLSVRTIVLIGGAGLACAFFLLGSSRTLVLVAIGALCYGACEGSLIPTLQDRAVDASPDDHRGAVMAVWVGAARLGQTTGPLVAGVALTTRTPGTTLMGGAAIGILIRRCGVFAPPPRHTQREGARTQ